MKETILQTVGAILFGAFLIWVGMMIKCDYDRASGKKPAAVNALGGGYIAPAGVLGE
jgi:hypothetical protein